MSISTFALILASVSLSALAQVSFKFGVVASQAVGTAHGSAMIRLFSSLIEPSVLLGLGLYGISTLLWLSVLGRIEVSKAYPFIGLGFVLTALFGKLVFGDSLGMQRVVGMLVVIGGIALLAQS